MPLDDVNLALVDLSLGSEEQQGDWVAERIKHLSNKRIPVAIMTAFSLEPSAAKRCAERMVEEYLKKPVPGHILIQRCELLLQLEAARRKAEAAVAEAEALRRQPITKLGGISVSVLDPHVKRTIEEIDQHMAKSLMPVLIVGDTGTGKESIAQEVHDKSGLTKDSFRVVNCATFTDTLIMAELFGRAAGSFTDAKDHRLGLVMEAAGVCSTGSSPSKGQSFTGWLEDCGNKLHHKGNVLVFPELGRKTNGLSGTLFLDEVADLSAEAQAALLRFLDGHGIMPVGYSGKPLCPGVRVVAATNRVDMLFDPEFSSPKATTRGGFRKDLLWRLAGWIIELPPLHDRVDDAVSAAVKRAGTPQYCKRSFTLSEEAKTMLREMVANRQLSGSDPLRSGNFRNLNWLVDRACWIASSRGPEVTVVDGAALQAASLPILALQRRRGHRVRESGLAGEGPGIPERRTDSLEVSLSRKAEELRLPGGLQRDELPMSTASVVCVLYDRLRGRARAVKASVQWPGQTEKRLRYYLMAYWTATDPERRKLLYDQSPDSIRRLRSELSRGVVDVAEKSKSRKLRLVVEYLLHGEEGSDGNGV